MTNTMKRTAIPLLAVLALGVAGCTTIPTGPSRMAMPGSGKDFDQFRADDAVCRQYAMESTGGTPTQVQENSAVKSAAIGTVVGAAAGAAIGGSSHGAAAGAGVGLLMGALSGAAAGNQSGYAVQRRYDDGYSQCMYSKGHRVAMPAGMARQQQRPAPSQPYYAPPAPSDNQPPPPQAQVPYYDGKSSPPQGYYNAPPPPGSAPPPPSAIIR